MNKILCIALLLAGCNQTASPSQRMLSYQELVDYPSQCEQATAQLEHLHWIQRTKNFDPDPDNLNNADRAYNSRLKASIWWYAYRCGKS